jgi:glycosyltransferase involved in cell wall biosynthesis
MSTDSTVIGCIVPVFNGARYLRETLDSILAQTYRPLEVIVADDGSTDDTAAIADSYGPPVRRIWQPNSGVAAARNLGVTHTRGAFIAFLDADDLWHAEKLERQMQRFTAHPDLGMSMTHLQNFWIPELQHEAERLRDHRVAQPIVGYSLPGLLVRRTVIDAVGPFDVTRQHTSEEEWFLRARRLGVAIEMLPEVLASRRLHDANTSRLDSAGSVDEFLHLLKDHLDSGRRQAVTPPQTPGKTQGDT